MSLPRSRVLRARHVSALAVLFALAPAVLAQTGALSGVVVDGALGESLIGVNVQAFEAGTETRVGGAATDLDGRYRIANVAPGAYDLVFSYIGYTQQRVTGVGVAAGETKTVDVALSEAAVDLGEEVVIEATMIQNSDAALLAQRARAAAVSDAVGADAIARSGSSTASDAMKQVTGASVVDGRYVFVRGLGDRYLNVQLNGAVLPSSDPDRNAVPLDLFPSGLLDNIVTSKTFTPDRPGSFTGGAVDIGTRAFPERLTVSFSASGSVDTNALPGDDVLGIPGGGIGLLGTVEGGLPAELESADIPNIGETFGNPAAAEELTRLSRLFDAGMAPVAERAPLEQSYSASVGNQTTLLGRPLGFVGSLNWSRNESSYSDGRFGQYSLPGNVQDASALVPDIQLATRSATDEVLWGGLLNLALRPAERHEVGLNLIYNRSAEATAAYRVGGLPRDLSASQVYETRALETTERALGSAQLRGEHILAERGVEVKWTAALSQTAQDEPDLRYFSNHFSPGPDSTYSIAANLYPEPTRYFRDLTENSATANLDVTVPVRLLDRALRLLDRALRLKVGGAFDGRAREFRERRFEFQRNSQFRYEGDPEAFFGTEGVGVVDTDATGNPIFGNYVVDLTSPRNNYDGDQTVAAGYALLDALLTDELRVIAGARLETTDITVENFSTPARRGTIRETDVLPALSAVYAVGEGMNVRAAYGRTLARPTFREFAPYASYDFAANAIFLGNPDLERTLIDNFDVRWEWFYGPGMIVAASGFYKQFDGPIERVISPQATNLEVQFRNLADATVFGAEFEARTRLGFLADVLQDVRLGGNLTLVQSAVSIAPDELAQVQLFDPGADDTRPLQGQSPYVLNLDLGYENVRGTALNLYYNLFGERLYTVARGGQPDYYEQPRAVLDFIGSQALGRGFTLKASAKNLLGADFEISQDFKGQDFVHIGYDRGRSFSLGVSYRL